jgi:signal transduction histidine kinase
VPTVSEPFTNPPDDRVRRYESLQAALDLIDQGFTLFDSDLRMLAWNKTFLRLLGFPPQMGYVGAPFESFLRFNAESGEYGSADPQRYVDERLRLARTFEPHEFERTRPDGTVLRVRGVPVPGHGFVTLYSDITAQKNAERMIGEHNVLLEARVAERSAELRRSEAQMRLITDSIPALIGYFDRDRVYRYINRGYQEWFGLDPANPSAARAKAYLGAETYAGIRHHVVRALNGEAVTYEYETAILGGRQVLARTTLIPDITADGSVAGCFDLTFDITEERRAQAMLVQAQKMEVLGQLTSGLAHDFNNILTVIIGNLAALSAARGSDETVAEFVEPAADAARRGAELIKNMLSFSRKQALQAQANDVSPLIVSVSQMLRRSLLDNRQLDIAVGATPLWAWIDAHRLQSTLLNLIVNARDATQARGRIGVNASAQALDETRAAALQVEPGRYVRIEVSDDGAGMDAPTLARVFEPFFTTKRPGLGTGLGLAMVHDFVKQSGGAIRIESKLGQGTTVSLWLPASEAGGELPLSIDQADRVARSGQGLALLVDDDPEVRKVVRRLLLELGFAVIEAEDGTEAMQILNQTQGIVLLLSDVVMPGGTDGRALAAHARERGRVPRVVLMSGYAPDEGQTSDVPMLVKPFTKAQLEVLLAEYPA